MLSERTKSMPRLALSLILLLFVLSGVSGLIYQSVWSQYLGLILGHAAYAQSLVLSTFMGGMALGAWWASRFLASSRSLLRTYGLLEGAIGVFGIAFHGLFQLSSGWLFNHWLPTLGSPALADASRYLLALLLILPQTVLLGMTFPVMSAGLIRWQPGTAGRVLGGLYFFNSIGAAIGALLATFWLVPAAGLPGAMTFAGALNLLVALLVLLLRVPERVATVVSADVAQRAQADTRLLRFVLVAAWVTGAASFMYEIGWVRMLSLVLGSSLHTFELMLAAFIGGLALGGLYIRKHLDGIARPLRYLGWVQVLMGIAALATLPLYDQAFGFIGWLLGSLARTDGGYTLYNLATAGVSMAIMLPAAFFAGMTLPLMTYALLRQGVGERSIGLVYAANTIGAIAGVLLMVHVVMPLLGLKLSMVLAASIDIGLGLVILRRLDEQFRPGPFLAAVAASAAILALVMVASQFDPRRLASGVYRTGVAQLDADAKIFFLRDGKTASIAVYGQSNGSVVIATNGKPDASIMMDPARPPTSDEPTMIMAGLLALAHHPQPKRLANIGFGSGLTTHTLASSTQPIEITSIEIEPAMVLAASLFGASVERAFNDPRSHIVYDDARAYFAGGARTYDVIVSEPSNPWVSGVAKLFSQEFYDFIPRHLEPGGLLVQWVQAYEISDRTLLSILAALDGRFRDYAIYTSNNFDLLIVASPDQPLPPLRADVFADAAVMQLGARVGITSVGDLSARLVASREMVQGLLAVTQPLKNSDFFPTVAHAAPRDRYMNQVAKGVATLYLAPGGALTLLGVLPVESDPSSLTPPVANLPVAIRRQGLATLAGLEGKPEGRVLEGLSPLEHSDILVLRQWGGECFAQADGSHAVRMLARAFRMSLARTSMDEARAAWAGQAWVHCADGAQPPPAVGQALTVFRLAFDAQAGAELLNAAAEVIATVPSLNPDTLSDLYALAMVGAARAGQPEEILALHRSSMVGVPLPASDRLQLDLVAQLSLHAANAARAER
ncbi:MAG: spermidine synthase [Rhodanobacteraceae bacterium]|nr:spermidine synthase [Rhodanobacteraceae bacterium]